MLSAFCESRDVHSSAGPANYFSRRRKDEEEDDTYDDFVWWEHTRHYIKGDISGAHYIDNPDNLSNIEISSLSRFIGISKWLHNESHIA